MKRITQTIATLLLLLVLVPRVNAQAVPVFHTLDSLARTITYKGDLKRLSHDLTAPYTTEKEKARAIFIWVTENIAYDVKAGNDRKSIKPFKCKNGKNCEEKYATWEAAFLEKVLRKKEAVCEGYSRLFKKLCDYAELRTDVVPGYIKNEPAHIGKMGVLDHAWNGIYLDGSYYYLDATWAAGGCSKDRKGRLKRFHKKYCDYYWLTPAHSFQRDHFPKDTVYPFTTKANKERYKNQPYIVPSQIQDITILTPAQGIIEARQNDTITICFSSAKPIAKLQLNTNAKRSPSVWMADGETDLMTKDGKVLARQVYVPYLQEDDTYTIKYIVTDEKVRYLDVLADHRRLIRFNVRILQ